MKTIVSPSGLHLLEQVEDLRLHGDVQRRHRLVADQQLRVEDQGAGDGDPLALPTRELVRGRVAGHVRVEPDASSTPRPPRFSCSVASSPDPHRLGDDVADPVRGVQREIGSWKTIWNPGLRLRMPSAGSAVSSVRRGRPARGGREQPNCRPADGRLAAARLADEPRVSPATTSKLMPDTAWTLRRAPAEYSTTRSPTEERVRRGDGRFLSPAIRLRCRSRRRRARPVRTVDRVWAVTVRGADREPAAIPVVGSCLPQGRLLAQAALLA